MSTSTKQSVVWLDSEKKGWKKPLRSSSKTSKTTVPSPELSPVSNRHLIVSSPSPWIDLRSIASDEKSDADNESIDEKSEAGNESIEEQKEDVISTADTQSIYTPSEGWTTAAGYERGVFPLSYYETYPPGDSGSNRFSKVVKTGGLEKPAESIVYPNRLRFIGICVSLVLSTFPTALDRTIVSTAM
jgi:hypothetical protein